MYIPQSALEQYLPLRGFGRCSGYLSNQALCDTFSSVASRIFLCKKELTNLTLVTMVTCTPTLAAASYRALADLGAGRSHHFSASDSIVRSR